MKAIYLGSIFIGAILGLQEQRQKAKGEKLAKIRAGEKGAVGSKPAEHTAISKKFYGQLVTDSHYVGDDYDVFGAWLGSKGKGTPLTICLCHAWYPSDDYDSDTSGVSKTTRNLLCTEYRF